MSFRLPRNVWVFLAYVGLSLIWYARVLPPSRSFIAYDPMAGGFPDRQYVANMWKEGNNAWWNPTLLGGVPTYASMMVEFFYPSHLLWRWMEVDQVVKWDFVFHTALAAFAFFLLLRFFEIRPLLAFAGGIALAFGWIPSMAFAGHITKVYVFSWFPILLLCIAWGVRSKGWLPFLLAGGIMGLMLWVQHLQMTYYAFLSGGIWVLLFLVASRPSINTILQTLFRYAIGVVVALWIGAAQWLPGLFYIRELSIRSTSQHALSFAASWSASWQDLISIWVPIFSGLSVGSSDTYWGDNPFRHDLVYAGWFALIGLILFVAAFRKRHTSHRPLAFAAGGNLLVFALIAVANRTPVFSLFYHFLPFFKVFRAHGMALIYVATFAIFLGVWGIELFLRDKPSSRRLVWGVGGGLILMGLVGLASPSTLASILQSLFHPDKSAALHHHIPLLAKAFLWVGLMTTLWAFWPSPVWVPVAVGIELFTLTRPFVQPVPSMKNQYMSDLVIRSLYPTLSASKPSRILPLGYRTADNRWSYWDLQTAAGNFPFMPKTYAEWIGTQGFMLNILSFSNFYRRPEFVDLTDISWILMPALPDTTTLRNRYATDPRLPLLLSLVSFANRFERVQTLPTSQGTFWLLRNPHNLGRFSLFFASRLVPSHTEVRALLTEPGLHRRIWIYDTTAPLLSDTLPATTKGVTPLLYAPGNVRVEVQTSRPAYLFFSENYHPQWKAWVDGQPVPVYRAFHTFQAVSLPEGRHEVVWRYVPTLEMRARWLTIGGLLLWGTVILILLYRTYGTRRRLLAQ